VCANKFIQTAWSSFFYAGYGVVAEQEFKKGDFIVEYTGVLITNEEAARREAEYETEDVGCFMYYFVHKGKPMWLAQLCTTVVLYGKT